MSRLFYHVMQDNAGNLLFDVSGTMRIAGSGTVATIYGDEALTVILPNPMTNHPSFGSFKCFLGAGDYDFYMAKGGYTFETLTGVQGHGTMAQQDAGAVAITGGSATLTAVAADNMTANTITANASMLTNELTANTIIYTATLQASAKVVVGTPYGYTTTVEVLYDKGTQWGSAFRQSADAGSGGPASFLNASGGQVGTITTTGSAAAYNTASDARLKHAITTLVGELAVIRALRPVRFRWNVDDSEGVGFLAQEVAEHVQGVVTGEPDAVEEDGSIRPQMIDYAKLVPWIVGAVQTLAGQVETLTERVHILEEALGV